MELYESNKTKGSEDNLTTSQTQSTVTLDREGKSKDEDYNPFEHRNVPHPTSTLESLFHLVKSSLGSGLLAMPAAFKHAGIVPGCIGVVIVAFIATHCVHILVSTSREICRVCRVPSLNYTDTCERVFKNGPKKLQPYSQLVRHFADYAMAAVCLGGTSVYVIFIASSLKNIIDDTYPDNFGVVTYCWLLFIPLTLITQFRHLKFLVPFSVLANICLMVTFVITCYYTFSDLPDVGQASLAVSPVQWPLFVSTAIFAMEGINVVMPVENEMAKPEHFLGCPGVLSGTMGFVALLYGVIGLFGYLKYGEDAQGSITLNLPQEDVLALVAKVLVALAVFFTYCLQMYAPMDIIWTRIRHNFSERYHNAAQIIQRTVSVLLTVTLAAVVPDLELLIGLVGALFFSTLGLLIPVVIQTVHKWDRGLGKYSYILWKNTFLLLFYLLVVVSGCYASIKGIVERFSSDSEHKV